MSTRGMFLIAPLVLAFCVPVVADTFTEDFTQDDGPPAGWVVVSPTVLVESEQLTLTPGGTAEVDTIAGQGGSALWFESISHIEFDMAYPGEPASWPFDHGGVIFGAQSVGGRYSTICYAIDYIAAAADNSAVGRFRLGRFANGVETAITQTDVNITEYEGLWAIDLTETTITFSFNGVEQFSVEDAVVPRTGHVGFWAYQAPPENKVAVDNLVIEHSPGTCPGFETDSVVMTEGKGNALVPIRIPIGANATEAYEVTVTSQDPDTAAPVDDTLTFEAGGPLVQNAEIVPVAAGQTILSLAVTGADCSDITVLTEVLGPVSYFDDFAQADGTPEGWFIASDTAQVISEELSLSAPGQPFVWYGIGGVGLNVPKIDAVRARVKFAQAALPVGAHGGMYLSPVAGAVRDKGYMIDVIERATDNGFRIYKDNAPAPGLVDPRPPYVWDDQWHDWELVFTSTGFTFSVDDVQLAEVEDLSYRGGYLSFWCYTGAEGQNLFVDDVEIEFGASSCPGLSPLEAINRPVNAKTVFTVTTPFGANSDGTYEVTVTSTDPAVAVPVGAVDGSLVLTFPQSEDITAATFEAECLSPGTTEFVLDTGGTSCLETSALFTVREPGASGFCDDFAQADGPPEDWTIYAGDWTVAGEKLVVECAAGGETWIWASAPAQRIEGAETIRFSLDLTQTTPDGVGRHGGIMFCADAPTTRWFASGYEIDWIDREADRGYRLLRSDGGVHTVLAPSTGAAFDLGTNWLVELDGENIRVSVDDVLIFDVVDPAYREGYFGMWTYCNTTHAEFDDVEVGSCGVNFIRGEANGDGEVNISDPVWILNWLFAGNAEPGCIAASDANGDGETNISDPTWVLNFLFAGGTAPVAPYPDCGPGSLPSDETLGCLTPPAICQ